MFDKEDDYPGFENQGSDDSDEDGASSTIGSSDGGAKWSQDFDNESRGGYDSLASETMAKSRRSLERDALRKYVRQRYMKRGDK